MLKGLSEKLRDALDKFTRGGADKEQIEELVREIQRSLIAADVDIELVFELSENIKKKSFAETPKGLTRKEYVIKTVYDELTNILGGEKAVVSLKPKKILLVGLYGSGKCVHKDTEIPLATGEIKTIKELYDKAETVFIPEKTEDGFLINNPGFQIFSLNPETLKIESKEASSVWKLKKNELVKVTADYGNGYGILTTPEHPFFVIDNGTIKTTRADELKNGDFVAVPKGFNPVIKAVSFTRCLWKKLPEDVAVHNPAFSKKIKTALMAKFGTLKNAYKILGTNNSYVSFLQWMNKGWMPLGFLHEIDKYIRIVPEDVFSEEVRIKYFKKNVASVPIKIPTQMTQELLEFLGFIYGDGCVQNRSVEFCSERKELLDRFLALSDTLFGLKAVAKHDKRRKNLEVIRISSKALSILLASIFHIPIGKKSDKLLLPSVICVQPNHILSKFIRAYFDCDGYVAKDHREIELVTASKRLAAQINSLLLRFNILAAISKKIIKGKEYYRLRIIGTDINKFQMEIGFSEKNKSAKLHEVAKISNMQGAGKQDMIPIGSLLKEVRERYGFSINAIQTHVNSYGIYERSGRISNGALQKSVNAMKQKITKTNNYSVLKALENPSTPQSHVKILGKNQGWINSYLATLQFKNMVNKSGSLVEITEQGKDFIDAYDIDRLKSQLYTLEKIAHSDVRWLRVEKIEKVENEHGYVYDLTVDNFHNFIANGFIVHNTTTAAKLARFYQRKGLKVAMICCDTVRPAAYEQLKQLAERIDAEFYGEKGEKDSSAVLKNALKKIKTDIVIVDSSGRNALDSSLIEEIKNIDSVLQPDERILVIPADIGQAAKEQANAFDSALKITDVVVTKLDATAKGGGALTACYATGAKVVFVTVGETPEDLESYDPKKFVARLLGFPDLETLLEKAKTTVDEEKAKKVVSGEFSIEEFYEQIESVQKMGPLSQIMDMMGLGKLGAKANVDVQQEKMKKWGHIIKSMSKQEKANPDIVNTSRVHRIAKGSGVSESEVRELLSNYSKIKKMMKKISPGKLKRSGLFRQFGLR